MSTTDMEFVMTEGDELTLRKILGEELAKLPCGKMSDKILKIEQRIKNGDRFREIGMTRFRLILQTMAIVLGSPAVMLTALKIFKII